MKTKRKWYMATATLWLVASSVQASDGSWITDAGGNWIDTANWVGGVVPGVVGTTSPDTAYFTNSLTAGLDRAVTVDANRSIGAITFGNSSTNGYMLSGGPFRQNGVVVTELAGAGAHTDEIRSGIKLRGTGVVATFINNSADATLLIAGNAIRGDNVGAKTVVLDGTANALNHSQIAAQINDQIADSAVAVVKNGAGRWDLTGNSTFSGGLTFNDGTLGYYGGNTMFGAGAVNIAGNGVQFSHGNSIAMTIPNAMNVYADFELSGGGNTIWSGEWDLNGAVRTITLSAGTNNVISGTVFNGGLVKEGADELTLAAANTYTNGTAVSEGTLIGASAGAFGTGGMTVADGAALVLQNADTLGDSAELILGSGSALVLDFSGLDAVGNISLDSGVTALPAGTYDAATLSTLNSSGTYTGSGSLTVMEKSVPLGLYIIH